jgi:peroxiredoxin Q/BCP
MTEWLKTGQKAPDFTLQADNGEKIHLSSLRGSPVVLYFYPKDDTPGCTKEACSFRDRKKELAELGAKVLGVSPDNVESHEKFREKFSLNFPLLADPDLHVSEKYGAWGEKNLYGKTSLGIRRSTYLIDADGVIRKVWTNVKPDGHDEQVIEAIKELLAEPTGQLK